MYISIDVGGTNTRIAFSHDLKQITKTEKFPTPLDLEDFKKSLNQKIRNTVEESMIQGIAVGVPGIVDKKNGSFEAIINVPSLSHLTPGSLFDFEKNLPIYAENDAALAGLGEAISGSGKGFDTVAYLTLSTGVGGVKISNGRIDPYQRHFEPGHMILQKGGRFFDLCRQEGCFSAYCSGTAFREIYGCAPEDCYDKKTWESFASDLSIGLLNVIAMWGPDIIVLGGSLTEKYDEFFRQPLYEKLTSQSIFRIPPVEKTTLGDSAGLSGGFEFLRQKMSL